MNGTALEHSLDLAQFFGITPRDPAVARVGRFVHEHQADVVKPTFSLVYRGRVVPLGRLRAVRHGMSPLRNGRYELEFATPPEFANLLQRLCRKANRRRKRSSVGGKRY